MKKISILLIVVIGIFYLAGCSQEKARGAEETVKIGTLHPLSGGQALEGQEMRDAIRLAVQEKNGNGGIESLNGMKIELIESDHEGLPEKGITEVQKLDRQNVVGIIGAYSSNVALTATQEAERAKVPFLVDIGTVNEITERGFEYTFRIQPPASSMGENFLSYMEYLNGITDDPLKTAVIVHEDSVFGSSIANLIEKKAETIGIDVLSTLPHVSTTADMSSTINRIVSQKPDIVIMTTYLNDGTLLTEGINDSRYIPRAIIGVANGAFSNDQFIKEHADINHHIMDVNYSVNPQAELTNEVREKFEKEFNKNLSPNAAYSYTVAKVLIDAIERAGSTDHVEIQKALRKTKYEDHILPQGAIEFDKKGQNINARAVLSQIFDGKTKVVYPEKYAEEEPVFPPLE